MTTKQIRRLLVAAFKEWNQDNAPRMAAALAYYTIFSLAPLLLLVIAIAGILFGQEAAQGQIIDQFRDLLGQQGAETLQAAITNANQTDSGLLASMISIVVLFFGASGVFGELQGALNTIWEVKAKPNLGFWALIRNRFLSFSMILVIAFLLMVSLVISAALAALNQFMSGLLPGADVLWQVLNFCLSLGILTVLFALIFKVLPDAKIVWKDVWIGALTTAVLFSVGKLTLGIYIGNGALGSAYGAASFLLILLFWLYYSAQILLFGAELTQIYASRYGSGVISSKYAVSIAEKTDLRSEALDKMEQH